MTAQMIAALVVAGVPLEAALEHTVMPRIQSPLIKAAIPVVVGVAACWATNVMKGMDWQSALSVGLAQGLTVAGSAMAVHGTAVGTVPGGA